MYRNRKNLAKLGGVVFSVSTGILGAFLSAARGQSATEKSSYFGDQAQGNATFTNLNPGFMGGFTTSSVAVGPNACVPTATLNGLTYLENYQTTALGSPNPFGTDPNGAVSQINVMAAYMNTWNTTNTSNSPNWVNIGGTYLPSAANGLQGYLANNSAPKVTVFGQASPALPAGFVATSVINQSAGTYNAGTNVVAANPSPSFLANALQNNDGVEMGLQWGNYNTANNTFSAAGGGHFVTLESMNMSGGVGTMTILDPWGDVTSLTPTASPISYNFNVSTTSAGLLYITYGSAANDIWAGGDESGFQYASGNSEVQEGLGATAVPRNALVVFDLVEAVPEPTSIGFIAAAVGALSLRRRQRAVALM